MTAVIFFTLGFVVVIVVVTKAFLSMIEGDDV